MTPRPFGYTMYVKCQAPTKQWCVHHYYHYVKLTFVWKHGWIHPVTIVILDFQSTTTHGNNLSQMRVVDLI